MPKAEHEWTVGRWYDALFTRGDLEAVDNLVGPDFVAYGAGGDGRVHETHGREGFRGWLRWYLSAFAEGEWTVHDVISEGDRAVVRYSGWATYRGGLLGIPPRKASASSRPASSSFASGTGSCGSCGPR